MVGFTAVFLASFAALLICVQVNGTYLIVREPCPGNRQPGDRWYLPECVRCICNENNSSYVCEACGVLIYETDECYMAPSGRYYPDCCESSLLCVGDEGFNRTLFDEIHYYYPTVDRES